jgi:membrane protein implicated in regulation of membrane protease activity
MGNFWALWWVWMVAGLALASLELILPGYIFLGFALGALITGALLLIGVLGANLALLFAVFALASVLGWFILRRLFGPAGSTVKIWHRDINDN